MSFLHYNRNFKSRVRNLRNHSTFSEVLLWNRLKGRQVLGYQFNRQKPIGQYIVDFYCKELNLVIEVDGSSHIGREAADAFRQGQLEEYGLTVIRFTNTEVKQGMEEVIEKIRSRIKSPFQGGSRRRRSGDVK